MWSAFLNFSVVLFTLGLLITAGGCGDSRDGDSDLAGSVTGPGIEVRCLQRHPRAPGGVGDTDVAVQCGGGQAAAAEPAP